MKALILAAGMGNRLGKYTHNLPKGMLKVFGKPLIGHQIDAYKRCSVEKIIIVTGYKSEQISFPGITYYKNPLFDRTNMVESLMCARDELDGEVILSYADILFEDRILKQIFKTKSDIAVAVDLMWTDYWKSRYGDAAIDTESLKMDQNGNILHIGNPNPPLKEIDGRYVGLLKFSKKGTDILKSVYDKAQSKSRNQAPWRNSKSFRQGYMTDLIQEIIDAGYSVQACKINKGWLEFDTNEDYEKVIQWSGNRYLERFFKINCY